MMPWDETRHCPHCGDRWDVAVHEAPGVRPCRMCGEPWCHSCGRIDWRCAEVGDCASFDAALDAPAPATFGQRVAALALGADVPPPTVDFNQKRRRGRRK